MTTLSAQDLSVHRWENRLLILLTEDTEDINYKKQLEELSNCREGITDRKLIVYQSTRDNFRNGQLSEGEWKNSPDIYKKYKGNKPGFQVLLIGLDGGVKMDQAEMISCEKIFGTIDSMPMRKAEMRKNKEG
ncbi:DUF4174 domain-containing protein [Gillisia sp. Q332]|uniref:DUF4174 domain-containing protein n=1 Tax=Gillisia xinjiangensis TaxID=3384765 RepID=UPI00391D465B